MSAVAMEVTLMRRCAGEIAAAVGPAATLIELGGGARRAAALLFAALEAPAARVSSDLGALAARAARRGSGRQLLFCPGSLLARFVADDTAALLRGIAALLRPDAMVVVDAIGAAPAKGRARTVGATPGRDHVRFRQLAAHAGWSQCQFWTDGQARVGIHVLERSASSM